MYSLLYCNEVVVLFFYVFKQIYMKMTILKSISFSACFFYSEIEFYFCTPKMNWYLMKPKLSVIIPVYNAANFLERCLESVLNQTIKDLEVIAVNDGSKDGSLLILNEFAKRDSRLTVLSKENEGVVLARMAGLRVASSDYIYYLDADDYIEPDLVEEALFKMQETDSDILLFNFNFCTEGVETLSRPYEKEFYSNIEFLKYIWMGKGYNALWTYIHKKSLYANIHISKEISFGEDLYLTTQLAYYSNRIAFFNSKPLLHYIIHKTSISNSRLDAKKVKDILLYPELINDFMKDKPEFLELEKYIYGLRLISNNILLSRCWFENAKERSKESVMILKKYPDLLVYKSVKNMRKLFLIFSQNYYLGLLFALYYRMKGKISPFSKH